MSMTSYVVDGGRPEPAGDLRVQRRPGLSSSVWLHLGLLGPRRVLMGDVGRAAPPPYGLPTTPSPCSRSATWSSSTRCRPATPAPSRAASRSRTTATRRDIESRRRADPAVDLAPQPLDVAEVPRRRVLRHDPRRRPGRAPADPVRLVPQRPHAHLSVLDLATVDFETSATTARTSTYLPTYAAIAHYHGKHGRKSLQDRPRRGRGVRRRATTRGRCPAATGSPPAERAEHVTPARRADRAVRGLRRPRRPADRARAVLHRAAARRAAAPSGRLDGRFTGRWPRRPPRRWTPTRRTTRSAARTPPPQPLRPRRARLRERPALRADLADRVQPWSFKEFEGQPVDVTAQLARAMRANPHLQGARRLRLLRRRHPATSGPRTSSPTSRSRTSCGPTSSTRTTRPAT